MRGESGRGQTGHAAVEAAIVLPLCVVVLLALLQLGMLQHARILAEYAAYQAARAGIVHGGDPRRMEAATAFALAPTVCPTRLPAAGAVCAMGEGDAPMLRQATAIAALTGVNAAARAAGSGFPGMRVDILSPYWPAHARYFRVDGGREMDFDDQRDARPFPEEGGAQPAADAGYREATLLTIRLLYWYELKIPLGDFVIWSAWAAQLAGRQLGGALSSPRVVFAAGPFGRRPGLLEHDGSRAALVTLLGMQMSNPFDDTELHRGDYAPVRAGDVTAMNAAAASGRYLVPIVVHHTMRMQSNFRAEHVSGCSCSTGAGCTEVCRAW